VQDIPAVFFLKLEISITKAFFLEGFFNFPELSLKKKDYDARRFESFHSDCLFHIQSKGIISTRRVKLN